MGLKRSATTVLTWNYNTIMLTHVINIYKPPASISQASTTVYHQPQQHHTVPKLSKFEYNLLISKLPFKKGDTVINKAIVNHDNITKYAIYKVRDIQEIHYMAEYNAVSGEPKCLHLEDSGGFNFWTSPSFWTTADPVLVERLGLTEWAKK